MSPAVAAQWFPATAGQRRIWLAVGLSVLAHGFLLALNFRFPDASKALRKSALDIILVNARSAHRPHDAQARAQANLDGGGNTDDNRRAKTPLPPTRQQADGAELQQMRRRVQDMEAAQQKLLTQARSLNAVASTRPAEAQPAPTPELSGLDLAESARAMARLEAEIGKTTEEYNKRPRKKFVGARTSEYALAPYLDAWRQKIERIGTLNYPDAARGKIYGKVVLYVELRAEDGSIYHAEISRSSGHKILDQAAMRILRMAAPFGPVPRQGLGGATVLSFARTWYFTQGDAVNTAARND